MAALFIVPGLLALYIVGGIADTYGIRAGLLIVVPIFLVGAWILSSGSLFVRSDINRVWTSTAAQAEVMFKRQQGEVKLLLVRNVDVHYDSVQVLFGVNFEVDEGEIVALLGTNGAGKSTLLRAVSGLEHPHRGVIRLFGVNATYLEPEQILDQGVALLVGGKMTFPGLTVRDNLRVGEYSIRRDGARARAAMADALDAFPELKTRLRQPAGTLSGGEQQMLALARVMMTRPRLLMIDELALGLAPKTVDRLMEIVRRVNAEGTTVILVEQSVNRAMTLAERAYFIERGQVRFEGPTAELLTRDDLLRPVFLADATAGLG